MLRARELNGARLPARLRDLAEPPTRLFVVGELPAGPGVAVVGTRTPTAEASDYARFISKRLTELGMVVYSGGASGIDSQAHLGALDAGGATVVVAPSSFDCPYPAENGPLFERIVRSGGAFVSEHEQSVLPTRPQFFARNACLAALCHAVVIVETRHRGGARNAAKWARELGRPVFAVPNAPWLPNSAGCLAELKLGARVLSHPEDVVAVLRGQNVHPFCAIESALPLFPDWPAPPHRDDPAEPTRAESSESALRGCRFGVTFRPPSAAQEKKEPASRPIKECGVSDDATGPTAEAPQPTATSGVFFPDEDCQRILAALGSAPAHPDELCRTTGLSASRLQALLLTLTLEGILVSHPSGHVSKIKQ